MNFKSLNLVLLLCLFAVSAMNAQKTLRQKLADEFCQEITKKNISSDWNEQTMEQIGLAILPITGKYAKEIKAEFGLDMSSQEDYQKIGEIIGEEAGKNCPKFQEILENMIDNSMNEAESFENLQGTFNGLDASGSFAFVKIKDAGGREQKLWWMEYFPGSEELVSDPGKFKGKQVSVAYTEREVYEPKLKDYVKVKVLAGISVE